VWNSISTNTFKNENKGNDGTTMFPAGATTKFNRTEISQRSIIDPQTGESKADEINISVRPIPELQNIYNQVEVDLNDKSIVPTMVAGSIKISNKTNTVEIMAKNEIILRAPKITLDTSGSALEGRVIINSHDIENVSDSKGHFRVTGGPHINIDGGKNPVLIQSEDDIMLDKNDFSAFETPSLSLNQGQ
jgi:hypothetical protein